MTSWGGFYFCLTLEAMWERFGEAALKRGIAGDVLTEETLKPLT